MTEQRIPATVLRTVPYDQMVTNLFKHMGSREASLLHAAVFTALFYLLHRLLRLVLHLCQLVLRRERVLCIRQCGRRDPRHCRPVGESLHGSRRTR